MRFNVLGPIEVTDNGENYAVGGPKQRAVLALLIANAGRPVSTGSLIEGVYGDHPPQGARRSIQTYVSNLRGDLEGVIHGTSDGYELVAERFQVDALRFEDAVASASKEEPPAAGRKLREALALWRGHPYADVDAGETIDFEVRRLDEHRMQALEARIDADLAVGAHGELVPELESLTSEYPLRERFTEQLMIALYRSGRQGEALRAYERMRNYLIDEMGLDPSPHLRSLEQRILKHDESLSVDTATRIRRGAVMACDMANPQLLGLISADERSALLGEHSEAIDAAAAVHGGEVFATSGSASFLVFDTAADAAVAASEIQRRLDGIENPGYRLRVGIDVGELEVGDTITGPPVNRAAAIVSSAHGGQILLSASAHQEITESTGGGWVIRSLGSHELHGLQQPEAIHQLTVDGLVDRFPPLRSEAPPTVAPMGAQGVPGYEIREEVGAGVFGIVHRGYQPSVGREVAVKVIRPEWANRPDFVRRFEVEAQLIARLEHPHIVPLYDYWREPDRAFLVMRWIRGGSLQDRLESGPMTIEETTALLEQIAPALAAAHRSGVVHRDLKPANVLLDREGNAYLTDFGIAVDLTGGQRRQVPVADRSTPAYPIPEELTGEPITPRADVYALGMLLGECLRGEIRSITSQSKPEVPESLAAVLDKATDSDPQLRYQSTMDLLEAWSTETGLAQGAVAATAYTDTRNPYKGLAAFTELDGRDFHGRSELVTQLAAALARNDLVAAVGPSGIGKSSVVRAGLIPALRSGALPGSSNWFATSMVPGAYPFDELAASLLKVAVNPPTDLEDALRKNERGLSQAIKTLLPENATVLIAIDQFEELFTLCDDDRERSLFLDTLVASLDDPRCRVKFVCTMRADFFDRPLSHASFGALLQQATVPVTAPTRDELLDMTRLPAEGVGVVYEPGLAERIVDEVVDQPGGLPLLEFALTELFDARTADVITNSSYDESAGVMAALGRRAEMIYEGLNDAEQAACRDVFIRCVTVNPDGLDTRRRVRRSELQRLPHDPSSIDGAVSAFLAQRLLTTDIDIVTRSPSIELAHEALITRWERLHIWLDSFRDDLLAERRLLISASEWEASGADQAFLLTGTRLSRAEALAASSTVSLTSSEREFVARSRTVADGTQTQRRRRRRAIMAVLAAAAVVASVFAASAIVSSNAAQREAAAARAAEADAQTQSVRADEQADLAAEREAEASANSALANGRSTISAAAAALPSDPDLALMLAVAGIDATDRAAVAAADSAGLPIPISVIASDSTVRALLRNAKAQARTRREITLPQTVTGIVGDLSPDGRIAIAGGAGAGGIVAFDTSSGRELWTSTIADSTKILTDAKFVRGGSEVAVAVAPTGESTSTLGNDVSGLYVLDPSTGNELRRFDLGACGARLARNDVSDGFALVVRPTPSSIARHGCAIDVGEAFYARIDIVNGTEVPVYQPFEPAKGHVEISLHRDGVLAGVTDVGPGGEAEQIHRLIDIETGEVVFDGPPSFGNSIISSNDTSRTAIAPDGAVGGEFLLLYEVTTGTRLARQVTPSGWSFASRWLPDDTALVMTSEDGAVTMWDGADGYRIDTVLTGRGPKHDLGISSDGQTMLVFTTGNTASIVDLSAERIADVGVIDPCDGLETDKPFTLTGGLDVQGDAVLINATCSGKFDEGPTIASLNDIGEFSTELDLVGQGVALSPDGNSVAGARYVPGPVSGAMIERDRVRGSTVDLEGTCDWYYEEEASPGCVDPPGDPHTVWPLDVDYSTDGSLIAMSPGIFGYAKVWRVGSGELISTFPGGPSEFSGSGSRLVTIDPSASTISVRNTRTFEVTISAELGEPDATLISPVYALEDTVILAGQNGASGDLVVFDAETLEVVDRLLAPHLSAIRHLAATSDGSTAASIAADGSVIVWDVATTDVIDRIELAPQSRGSAVAFANDDEWLLVTSSVGPVEIFAMDTATILDSARDRLYRGFTDQECSEHFARSQCPTLDELQGG